MQEAVFILPCRDQRGNPSDKFRKGFISELVAAYGGATVTDGDGYWNDASGKTIREPVKVITIAVANKPVKSRLVQFAQNAAQALQTDAVYLRLPDNTVHLVNQSGAFVT